jgi:hypothetical protein
MSISDKAFQAIGTIRELLDNYDKSCVGCVNFDEEREICKLCDQRPPARIIARGCAKFDNIPF